MATTKDNSLGPDGESLDRAQKEMQTEEQKTAEDFKKKYSKAINTVDSILQGFAGKEKGLIDGLLEDFAPSPDSKRKPGISVGSIFKLIGYGIRNPGKIGDLLTMARNPEIWQNKTFQQEILNKESTWKFLDMLGERLPRIGHALANFGVKEFQEEVILNGKIVQEAGILDGKGLATLQPLLKGKSLDSLKEIANNFLDPKADQNKNIDDIVNLMLKNDAFKEYMSTKKESLKNYAVSTVNQLVTNENIQAQKKYYEELQKNGITSLTPEHIQQHKAQVGSLQQQLTSFGMKQEDMGKLAGLIPILLEKPEDLKKFYASYSNTIATPEQEREFYKEHSKATKEEVEKFYASYEKTKPTPEKEKEFYKKHSKATKEQIEEFDKSLKPNWQKLGADVIEMAVNDENVQKFLSSNVEIFQNIMVATAKTTAQKYLDDYKITDDHLKVFSELVPILMNNPKELQKLYKNGYGEPNYTQLTSDLLDLAAGNNNVNHEVKKFLKDNAKTLQEVMVNGAMATAQTHLDTYGVSKEALEKITDLVPILLEKPEQLKKFYEIYSPLLKEGAELNEELKKLTKKDFDKLNEEEVKKLTEEFTAKVINDLTKEVLEMAATNQKVQDYLKDKEHTKVFQEIMVNGAMATPFVAEQLEKYGITKKKLEKITDIVPILLDNPAALKKFYESFEKGDFIGLGKDLLELSKTNKTQALDEYIKNNNYLFKGVVAEAIKVTPILKQYGVKSDLVDLFSPLLTGKNADKVQGLMNVYEEAWKADPKEKTGKYIELGISLCKLLEEDPELKKQLENNSGNLGKIVQNVVDNVPFLKGYLGEMKVDDLAANIVKDPTGLREGIEAYQKGGKALAWGAGKILVNKMMDSEFRDALVKGVGTWLLGDGNIKQQVVNKALYLADQPSKTDELKPSLNLLKLAKDAIEKLDKPNPERVKELNKTIENGLLFTNIKIEKKMENMEISSINFSNSKFYWPASFKGSVLTNTSFEEAKLIDVNFEGATIDGSTLKSLETQIKNKSVSLKGVKIIGDIPAGTDLTNVDLSGADLSEVKSMKDVNLKGADLSKTKLPDDSTILEGAKNVVVYTEKELAQIDKLSNKIAKNLFGKKHGRQDSTDLIKESLKEVFCKLKTEDKNIDLAFYLEENMSQLAGKSKENGLSKLYYASKSTTTAGLVTGWVGIKGIYLDKKKILGEEFISKLDSNIQNNIQDSRKPLEKMEKANDSIESAPKPSFSDSELTKIERLSNKIVKNLFGDNHGRQSDKDLIKESLQEVFSDLKKQNHNADITDIIDKNMDKLAGKVDVGYLSTSRTGLSELYYANSNYTTTGLTTGGIYLDKNKMQGKEFMSNLTNHIDKEVGKEIKSKSLSEKVPNIKGHVVENKKHSPNTPNVKKEGQDKGIEK